jgi:hypothetical protein
MATLQFNIDMEPDFNQVPFFFISHFAPVLQPLPAKGACGLHAFGQRG